MKVSSTQVREAKLVVLTQYVAHWIGGVDGVADVLSLRSSMTFLWKRDERRATEDLNSERGKIPAKSVCCVK